MTQYCRPTALVSAGSWTGSIAGLADSGGVSDLDWVESEPVADGGTSTTYIATGTVPSTNTTLGWVIRLRAAKALSSGAALVARLTIQNSTGSTTLVEAHDSQELSSSATEAVFDLTPAEAALVRAAGTVRFVLRITAAGSVVAVADTGNATTNGTNLQAALDASLAGDTIALTAGATYSRAYGFGLPNRAVTIKTSGWSKASGVRATTADLATMATLTSTVGANGATVHNVDGICGSGEWTLEGIAITYDGTSGNERTIRCLCAFGDNWGGSYVDSTGITVATQQPKVTLKHCVIYNREHSGATWYHAKIGILAQTRDCTVRDSSVVNIHFCPTSGTQEAKAIGSYNGPGPFTIKNCFLEASSINMLIGGAENSIPSLATGGTIRYCHFYKRPSWHPYHASFVPSPVAAHSYGVKNLLEFKWGNGWTVEGNVFENSWSDAPSAMENQRGYGLLITWVDQVNFTYPPSFQNFTVRYNDFVQVPSHLQIAAATYGGGPSVTPSNVLFEHNRVTHGDIGRASYYYSGAPPEEAGPLAQAMFFTADNLTYRRNSLLGHRQYNSAQVHTESSAGLTNPVITDNVFHGTDPASAYRRVYGLNGLPTEGTAALAGASVGGVYTFAGNVCADESSPTYPSANSFPTIATFDAGMGTDGRIAVGSALETAAVAGQYAARPGADIDLVEQYTDGVVAGTPTNL